jgi:oxygen-independent coproporphyrinogen-3 oxidase
VAGLYFHIPFREARRSYDDAYYEVLRGDAARDDAAFDRFVNALDRELRLYAYEVAGDEAIETIYAGGGRPSLLPLRHVRSLLNTVLDVFDASAFRESTAEVNPADATLDYLRGLHGVGFDRLSIEVLSFFPDDLKHLGAPHTAAEAVRAIRTAGRAGFDTVSIDLAFGFPGQTADRWLANLNQAVGMGVPAVAVLEWPGGPADPSHDAQHHTPGASPSDDPPAETRHPSDNPPSSDGEAHHGTAEDQTAEDQTAEDQTAGDGSRDRALDAAKRFREAIRFFRNHEYAPYEMTHFARPGHQSGHLRDTYAHGSYIGVGPSAESFWWPGQSPDRSARRWANVSDLDRYVELLGQRYPPTAYRQTVDWSTLAREYVFLRLRTASGLDLNVLRDRYGVDLRERHGPLLDRLADAGLIAPVENGRVQLTPSGFLVADGITERLLRDRR